VYWNSTGVEGAHGWEERNSALMYEEWRLHSTHPVHIGLQNKISLHCYLPDEIWLR
jgi:hypothetical protein